MELASVAHDNGYVSLTIGETDEPILLGRATLLALQSSLEGVLRQWPPNEVRIKHVDNAPTILTSGTTVPCSECGASEDTITQIHYIDRGGQNGVKWQQCQDCADELVTIITEYVDGREDEFLGAML